MKDIPRELAHILGRPVGRGGGLRDPLPHKISRDGHVTVAVTKEMQAWVQQQANERGLSRASFLGMIIEGIRSLPPDELDNLICGNNSK